MSDTQENGQQPSGNTNTDFQKAVEWFFGLPYEEQTSICKESNPETPHSLNDKDLVPIWKKHCH